MDSACSRRTAFHDVSVAVAVAVIVVVVAVDDVRPPYALTISGNHSIACLGYCTVLYDTVYCIEYEKNE